MTTSALVWCSDCGRDAPLRFYTPDKVHCEDCGRIVGETDRTVLLFTAALHPNDGEVRDADTGKLLGRVEWDDERVERHDDAENAPTSLPSAYPDEGDDDE